MPEQDPQRTSARDVELLRRALRVSEAERRAVALQLDELRADVERIGASRSWRWGHASARLATRLLRRPLKTQGAVARTLARINAIASILAVSERQPSLDGPASVCIAISAASREVAHLGGDFHFATAVARELERRGHPASVAVLPEEAEASRQADVMIALRGRRAHTPRVDQLNVLWVISHPAELSGPECDGYDLVCVASGQFAEELRAQTTTPVMVLDQATDPAVFHPAHGAERDHQLVFVGNTRGVRRKVVHDLLPTRHDLAVIGAGWEGVIDARHVLADHVPNENLRTLYSSAAIVLNDHWDDMRAHGFVSNRVYDAVACGALVVSDRVAGIEDRFGGAVVTYETPAELRQLIDRFLSDEAERAARAGAGRERVLASHTIAHRVETLLETISARGAEVGVGFPRSG